MWSKSPEPISKDHPAGPQDEPIFRQRLVAMGDLHGGESGDWAGYNRAEE